MRCALFLLLSSSAIPSLRVAAADAEILPGFLRRHLPANVCGDGKCRAGEDCSSCESDCGSCPGGGNPATDTSMFDTQAGCSGASGGCCGGSSPAIDLVSEFGIKASIIAFRTSMGDGSEGGDPGDFPNMPCGVDIDCKTTCATAKFVEDIRCDFYPPKGNNGMQYLCEKSKRQVPPFLEIALGATSLGKFFEKEEQLCAVAGFKRVAVSTWYWRCEPCDGTEADYDNLCL